MFMKKNLSKLAVVLLVSVTGLFPAVSGEVASEVPLKSGPVLGESLRPYHPLLCNGKTVGQRWCMVCTERSRGNGMVVIFAREWSDSVKALTRATEEMVAKHGKYGGIVTLLTTKGKTAKEAEALTGGEVRFLNDAEKAQFEKLKVEAKELKLEKTSLNIFTEAGPLGFALNPEAALTVIVASSDGRVRMNGAYKSSELKAEKIKAFVDVIQGVVNLE